MERVSQMVSPIHAQFTPHERQASRGDETAEVSLERIYGPKCAEYFRRHGRPGVEAFYRGVELPDVPKYLERQSPPSKPIAAPKPAAEPTPAELQANRAAERKAAAAPYVELFGIKRGLQWFAEGKTIDECVAIVGREELARRDAALSPEQRLAAGVAAELAKLGKSDAKPDTDGDGLARFADSIKLPA